MKRRGYFITLHGVPGLGGSTQAARLADFFSSNDWPAERISYPRLQLKPTGPYIRKLLRQRKNQTVNEEELQLWQAVNRYQFEPVLKKKLAAGRVVIAENYTATDIAWGATNGLDLDWLTEIYSRLLKEDLAMVLDGKPVPIKHDKSGYEADDVSVERCRRWLLKLAKMNSWPVVNANQPIEQVQQDIQAIVSAFLRTHPKWQ